MVDEIDLANDRIEIEKDRHVAAIRAAAADIPVGESGECIECGLESKRLVGDRCAPCRDRTY